MKLKGLIVLMGTVIAVAMFSEGSARASRIPRIELLHEVSVAGTRVLLSDLLPANASGSLRTRAAEISLGAAPQPGNTRVLERDAVERQVSARQEVLLEVAVPERIVVSRNSRPITLTEVFEAIRTALQHNGITSAETLQPEDILLESQVFVGPGDSGLQVMRMDLDRGLRRARFLLWPSHDPKVLPFFVTARLGGELPMSPFRPSTEFSRLATPPAIVAVSARPVKQEILVAPGERATLMLRSDALRIFVDVVSLERGTLGQQIRVRMVDTGKIFNAQVDGRAHLEVKF
jgi:hypothetical protein